MTFKDIKVGDSVMQCTVVVLGIGCRPSFFYTYQGCESHP